MLLCIAALPFVFSLNGVLINLFSLKKIEMQIYKNCCSSLKADFKICKVLENLPQCIVSQKMVVEPSAPPYQTKLNNNLRKRYKSKK
jgi:hypothetical protein